MAHAIIFEKTATLNDGTVVDIRERNRNEETILTAMLQYLVKHLVDSGDDEYAKLLDSGEWVGNVLRGKYVVVLDARVGKDWAGWATLTRHWPPAELHVADIKVSVQEPYRGSGLGIALAGALLEYAPAKLPGVTRVVATVPAGDDAAVALCRRAGFQVEGLLTGTTQPCGGSADQLIFTRDVVVPPELAELAAEEGRLAHLYPPQWHETRQTRGQQAQLCGFLGGFDLERLEEVDTAGIWDWASRFTLALAERDPETFQRRTREEILKEEGLRVVPLGYLRKMAEALGYAGEE